MNRRSFFTKTVAAVTAAMLAPVSSLFAVEQPQLKRMWRLGKDGHGHRVRLHQLNKGDTIYVENDPSEDCRQYVVESQPYICQETGVLTVVVL